MDITVTTIDDRSPQITYEGEWRQGGAFGKEFDGTTVWTNITGSLATINIVGQCRYANLGIFYN